MSVGWVLSAVFSSGALACSHCGSTELYPYPGLFGGLGGVLGRVRYACRSCRRHSWLSPHAEAPKPAADDFGLEAPSPHHLATSLDALDIDIGAAPVPPPPTDLRALDDALALGRQRRSRKNH
jgi:hypothetical protein